VYLPKGGKAVLVGTGGFLVGILPRVEYETLTLDFQPGDRLVLYADGVTECMHKANALYTEVRLTRYLENASTLPLRMMYPCWRLRSSNGTWSDTRNQPEQQG